MPGFYRVPRAAHRTIYWHEAGVDGPHMKMKNPSQMPGNHTINVDGASDHPAIKGMNPAAAAFS
jgi:hypothetical protein